MWDRPASPTAWAYYDDMVGSTYRILKGMRKLVAALARAVPGIRQGRPSMAEVAFDPYDPSLVDDPWSTYAVLRDESPAYRNDRYPCWVLSRFTDVKEALSDQETYCSSQGLLVILETESYEAPSFPPGNLLLMDPPSHTAYRALVSRRFLLRRVGELEHRIAETAERLVDGFIEAGSADLVTQFAVALPALVFGEILGIPEADVDTFQRWSANLVSPAPTPEAMKAHHDASEAVSEYLALILAAKRADPADDLLSEIACGEVNGGPLSAEESVGFAIAMLIAGNDTTSNFLSNGAYLLAAHPDQRGRLRAEPELLPQAVEEILRYEPPVHGLARTLTRDVEKHGVRMEKGEKVLLLFAAANRDDRVFDDPERFDVTRPLIGHLSFGFGVHYCIGIHLGRLEGRIGLKTLLDLLGDYELAGDVHWRHLVPTRPMQALPVTFVPGRPAR